VQACQANVLAPLFAAAPAGDVERLRAAADKELEVLVPAITDGAWAAVLARVELRRDAVEDIAETQLGSILREEEARKAEVRESCAKAVRPAVRGLATPIVAVVLGALLKPLYKAHKEAVSIFWHRVNDIIERGLKENELRAFYRDARWMTQSLLPAFRKVRPRQRQRRARARTRRRRLPRPPRAPHLPRLPRAHSPASPRRPLRAAPQIRTLTRGEAEDEADSGEGAVKLLSELTVTVPELVAMMGGVTLYEVEAAFEESVRTLVCWGIYSFVAAVEVRRGARAAAASPAPPPPPPPPPTLARAARPPALASPPRPAPPLLRSARAAA